MSVDKSDMQFDRMLNRVLKKYKEPVPTDFSERILKQIKQQQEREILAKVVLQERLALAACIVFGIAAFILAIVFSHSITNIVTEINLTNLNRLVKTAITNWQLYVVFAGILGFSLYSLIDFWISETQQ